MAPTYLAQGWVQAPHFATVPVFIRWTTDHIFSLHGDAGKFQKWLRLLVSQMQVVLFAHLGVGRQHPRGPRLTAAPSVAHGGQRGGPVRRHRPGDGRMGVAVGRDGVRGSGQAVHIAGACRRRHSESFC